MHDFLGDAGDLDVHLQRGDAGSSTRHLEIHIAEVIFIAQNIGQHGKTVAFLDQPHGDTGHMRLQRHAGVHQRQTSAAHRGHGAGAVGFGDLRHQADRISEILRLGQHRQQRTLGQSAMADFAALGRTHAPGFAGGVRRHVVVEHKAIAIHTLQGVDDLLITRRA